MLTLWSNLALEAITKGRYPNLRKWMVMRDLGRDDEVFRSLKMTGFSEDVMMMVGTWIKVYAFHLWCCQES